MARTSAFAAFRCKKVKTRRRNWKFRSRPVRGTLFSFTKIMRYPAVRVFSVSRKTFSQVRCSSHLGVWIFLLLLPNVVLSEIIYPAGPQLRKDGTAVLVENFAMSPLSSRSAAFNSSDQLSRLNFM